MLQRQQILTYIFTFLEAVQCTSMLLRAKIYYVLSFFAHKSLRSLYVDFDVQYYFKVIFIYLRWTFPGHARMGLTVRSICSLCSLDTLTQWLAGQTACSVNGASSSPAWMQGFSAVQGHCTSLFLWCHYWTDWVHHFYR